ncbi:MAG: SCO family protein [Anaerolineaceae bacterium]|nr:SCO family protein [Anaerolineaceae bacterium]
MKLLQKRWLLPAAGLLIGLIIIAVLFIWLKPHTFGGTLLQSPQAAYDFSLKGPENKEVRLSDYQGKVVLLFFGFTYCPDVCPTTMANLRKVIDLLGTDGKQVQVVLITVDPARDTPERLKSYAEQFNPTFIGLTGEPDEIMETASAYGVSFEILPNMDPHMYFMSHTSTVMLIDPEGKLRVVYPYGVDKQILTDDIRYILSH